MAWEENLPQQTSSLSKDKPRGMSGLQRVATCSDDKYGVILPWAEEVSKDLYSIWLAPVKPRSALT